MNRCRHNPPCQRREYWGRGGAGVLFTCSEDGTVLLLLRASWVEQGGTWGIPGGGIGEGFYRTPVQPITDMRVFLEKAKEEVEEECGSLPPGVRSLRSDLPFTEYEDCGFRYVTFILDITRAQKAAWAPFSADGENDAFIWFPLDAVKKGRPLPDENGDLHDIHFGVTFTMGKLPTANPRRRNPEPTVEAQRDRHGDIAGVTVHFAGGSVSAIRSRFDKPDVMHVGWSELPESARGKGLGVQMYAALMDWALENGITLTSDEALSPAAGRVWEALAKRGYPIEKHPTARLYTEDDRSAWGADDRNKPFTLHRRNPLRMDFLEDFNAATVPSDLSRWGRMFPGVPVSIEVAHEAGDKYITLDRFEAQPGIRGTGAGTDAMRRLLDLADMHDFVVYLQPAPLDTGWPKKRLTDWYSSFGFGFEEGSEYGDMMRRPQAKGARRPNPRPTTAERTDPALWEAVKREVTAGSKGGVAGEWSARKAQLSVALYKQRGGGYLGPKSPQNALAKWTREDWRTRSGKPSLVTGERYLPSRAIAALTDAEYAATSRAKRAGMRKGQQFVPQPERIAAKAARYRKNPTLPPGFLLVTLAQARNMTGHSVANLSPRYSHAVVNSWGGFVSAGVTPEAAVSLALARVESLDDLARNGTLALDTVVYHGERAVAPWRDGYTMYVSTDKEYAKDYGDVVATPLRSLLGMGIFLGPDEDNVGGDVATDALSLPAERSRREWYTDYEAGTGKPSLGWWTRNPINGFTLTGDLASARKVFAPVRANPARRAGDKRYRKNPAAPEDVLEEYSYGKCAWLALALHERFGWPMTAEVQTDKADGARYVSHSWVTMPDGREVDIYGPQLEVDRFGGKETRMSRKALISLVRETSDVTEGWVVQRVAEANEVIDAYLLPELLLTNPARRAGDKRYRRNPSTYEKDLIQTLLVHGAKVYTYDTLPAPAKAAATEYLDEPHKSNYLVGELPTEYVKQRIMAEFVGPFDWLSFDAYHRWYVEDREKDGRMPNYPKANRWPSLLAGEDKQGFIWDGWHRFHAYIRAGHPTVPVYMILREGDVPRVNPARRAGDKGYRRNPSPREAEALRAIRANLTPDLLAGEYRACAGQHPMAGHCSVATEALYFTLGGKGSGYTPMNVRHPVKGNARGVSHWYLRTPDGRYLDPTADQFDTPVDYASGRGRGFPTPRQGHAEPPPSKRAATLLQRLGARKR